MSLVREGSSFEVEGWVGNWMKTKPSGEPQESLRAYTQFTPQTFIDLYIMSLGWSRLQGRVKWGSRYGSINFCFLREFGSTTMLFCRGSSNEGKRNTWKLKLSQGLFKMCVPQKLRHGFYIYKESLRKRLSPRR